MEPIPVLVIVGPTASGKSALAVKLAMQRNGEIISADSRQVYKGLDIGSGKITKREMMGVRHHLLDVISPRKVFSAHDFVRLGRAAIADIHARGKLPIVCGGTGFYIDALLGRAPLPRVERDEKLRAALESKSAAQLFALLRRRDPRRAALMDTDSERNNKVRLIRALEISSAQPAVTSEKSVKNAYAEITDMGGGISDESYVHDLYEIEWIGVDRADTVLRQRIHRRLLDRMKGGMVAEAKNLHNKGVSWRRMEALGLEYRYLSLYLRGHISKAGMLVELEKEIWQYARRQRTWWRRNKNIAWTILK